MLSKQLKKYLIFKQEDITYKVTKLNRTSEIGAYTGQSVSGEPGVTISLAKIIHMYMLTTIRFFCIVLLKGGNVYVT